MCSFASRNATDFSLTMLRFVGATAGLIEPRPGLSFNFSGADVPPATRAAPGSSPASRPSDPGAVNAPFNLDACWAMVDPLNGHERVAAVRA